MNKAWILTLMLFLALGVHDMALDADFTVTPVTIETTMIDGVEHTKIVGTVENEQGVMSDQVIQYLRGNPTIDNNLHVIAADAYLPFSYSTATVPNIIAATNNRYDHYDVIGGINGDYYNMTVGIPVEAYIRNYEVLSSGLGYERPVIGFKDSGEVIFGRPCYEGMELLIYRSDGALRNRLPVERINRLPFSDRGTTVFFSDYTQTITTPFPKLIIDTSEYKTDGYQTRYFGSGDYLSTTTDEITVPDGSFVIVSNDPYVTDVIRTNDRVVVQQKVGCGFEDVRFAIGTWEHLVSGGVATNSLTYGTAPASDNPRTAIGVTTTGDVILLTVDGRQAAAGMDGMSLYEVADLMVSLGAVEAYAMDGGGSTTMVVKDPDDGSYDITNSPSDGSPRRVSNAILFVNGSHPDPVQELGLPDLSERLPIPSNLFIDNEGVLRFNKVDHAEGYEIVINDTTYPTLSRDLPLNFAPGTYAIQVRAKGDGMYYADSPYSGTLIFTVLDDRSARIAELFRNYANSENK